MADDLALSTALLDQRVARSFDSGCDGQVASHVFFLFFSLTGGCETFTAAMDSKETPENAMQGMGICN